MAYYVRGLSLSPGNEQRLYWGSAAADQPGSRNWMGAKSPAIDAMIDEMLSAESREDFVSAVRALDRILTASRFVIPIWYRPESYLAHAAQLEVPSYDSRVRRLDRLPARRVVGGGIARVQERNRARSHWAI